MSQRCLVLIISMAIILGLAGCGGSGGGGTDGGSQNLNTGLAVAANYPAGIASLGGLVFALVNEFEQGPGDLNGDLDTADDVVHQIDPATGAVVNLAVSGTPLFAVNDNWIAWGTEEADEGIVDFNGDGDFGDTVLTVYNPAMPLGPMNPAVTNVSLEPVSGIQGQGDLFALTTSELEAMVDLNGDGDVNDFVVQIFDPATLTLTNTGLASNPMQIGLFFRNGIAAFEVAEAEQNFGMMGAGVDLNGDGDTADSVLFGIFAATGVTFPIGVGGSARAVVAGAFVVAGTPAAPVVLYAISETNEGVNLNAGIANDADTMDAVAAVFDVNTMTETRPAGGVAIQAARLRGSETRGVFSAVEADNGADYNVDGDLVDFVPFWVDLALPATAHNVGIAQDDGSSTVLPALCGQHFVMAASEADQGPNGTNYNQMWNDADTSDTVPFFVSMIGAATQPVNLTLAATQAVCAQITNDYVIIVAIEAANDRDLNVDGDTGDEHLIFYSVQNDVVNPTAVLMNTGPGNAVIQDCPTTLRVVTFVPEGNQQGYGDLNQDGDFDDYVLMTALFSKVDGGPLGSTVHASVQQDVGAMQFPMPLSQSIVVYPRGESETANGVNLNGASGDGDAFDTILQVLMLNCL